MEKERERKKENRVMSVNSEKSEKNLKPITHQWQLIHSALIPQTSTRNKNPRAKSEEIASQSCSHGLGVASLEIAKRKTQNAKRRRWKNCFANDQRGNVRFALQEGKKEANVLFNDALNTFYLRLYGVRHMVKDHSVRDR